MEDRTDGTFLLDAASRLWTAVVQMAGINASRGMNVAYGRRTEGWLGGIGSGNKHNEDWVLRVGERGTGNSEFYGWRGFFCFVFSLLFRAFESTLGSSLFNMDSTRVMRIHDISSRK